MSRSDIQAGGAFVRLFLKDELNKAITGAMKRAGKTVHRAGASIAKAGAAFSVLGGGLLAPIIAGVNTFAQFGDQLDKMSKRTGVAASELARLQFAAEQSGTGIEAIERAMREMQMNGMDPSDFRETAAAIAAIEDPVQRAQAAMDTFGRRVGTQLLPMLGDLDALAREADMLGIIPSEQEVENAAKVTDAINRIRRTVQGMFFSIGSSMSDAVLSVLDQLKTVTVAIGQWARNNRTLIITVAAVGTSLLALGGVLSTAGFALMGIGAAISFVASAVGVLLSPVGLLTAAVVAGTAAFIRYTDIGQRLWRGLIDSVMPMVETFKTAIGGIADALKGGDIQLAGEILMVGLELAVRQGVEQLKSIFGETFGVIANQILSGDLSGAWATVVDSMLVHWQGFKVAVLEVFAGVVISVSKMWTGLQNKISKWLIDLSQNSTFRGALAGAGIGVAGRAGMASLLGIDPNAMSLDMAEDAKRIIDEATKATQQGIEQSWLATVEQARQVSSELQQAQQEALRTGSSEASQRVKELEDKLAALRQQAAAVAGGAVGATVAEDAGAITGRAGGIGRSISGMFRAAAISAAGRGTSQEDKSLQELRAIRGSTDRLAIATERHYLAMTHS